MRISRFHVRQEKLGLLLLYTITISNSVEAAVRRGVHNFLSAFHPASGLKELPGEAMDLAAGLQFAGFPSVIATMRGISDEDTPKVADHAYQYLFHNGMVGLDPSDAATALNRAVLAFEKIPKSR
jgi:hypothetical protein